MGLRLLSAWLPVLASLAVLGIAAAGGALPFAVAVLPCAVIVAGGVGTALSPGVRSAQVTALGAILALLLLGGLHDRQLRAGGFRSE